MFEAKHIHWLNSAVLIVKSLGTLALKLLLISKVLRVDFLSNQINTYKISALFWVLLCFTICPEAGFLNVKVAP